MFQPRVTACGAVVSALLITGCATEKAPPEITWLSPTSNITVAGGDAVALRFRVLDPVPERGSSEVATWRINVGPDNGAIWWTQSGVLSSAPSSGGVEDTVQVTWHVAENLPGTGPLPLLLTAKTTDGVGQTAADFTTATWYGTPLISSGLWWSGGSNDSGFGYADAAASSAALEFAGPSSPEHMTALDGQDLIVTGLNTLKGWPITSGTPASMPTWEHTPTLTSAGEIRYIRRAPFAHTSAAWAEVGWPDRCAWHNAEGQVQRSWMLENEELLIDAGVIGEEMVALARTNGQELRLIRFNLSSGARLESLTWTPEAPGSTGPNGAAWLLDIGGHPAALESDGTTRVWNGTGGATPLSSGQIPGEGAILRAGRTEDGTNWAQRNTSILFSTEMEELTTWEGDLRTTALDRANGILWVLTNNNEGPAWIGLDRNSFAALTPSFAAGEDTFSGAVMHNQPGIP